MARIGAPHGLRGYFFLHIFSRGPSFFASLAQWWCRPPDGDWRQLEVADCHQQNARWIARLAEVGDRDAAVAWRGGELAILREQLPPAAAGETYWRDLIGLRVVNAADESIGKITGVMDIGAHDVLEILAADGRKILLPFVDAYVLDADVAAGVVRVDWQTEW